jgi:cyclic-di-GMP-binding protein
MAKESSFDIVSEFDHQELVNAVDIARREIANRYDFKGTKNEILLEKEKITLECADDYKLRAVFDILQSKAIKRGLSLKIFDPQKVEQASGNTVRQEINLRQSLTSEQCHILNKKVREAFPKVHPQIQGDTVRVVSKSLDELQSVIQWLRGLEFEAPLQAINYR